MREKLFLFAFFAVTAIAIVVVPILLNALLESSFPQASEFLESKSDFIIFALLALWLWKSHADYFERKAKNLSDSMNVLRNRIETLEEARRG